MKLDMMLLMMTIFFSVSQLATSESDQPAKVLVHLNLVQTCPY